MTVITQPLFWAAAVFTDFAVICWEHEEIPLALASVTAGIGMALLLAVRLLTHYVEGPMGQ